MENGKLIIGAINIDTEGVKSVALNIMARRKRIKDELDAIEKEMKYVETGWDGNAKESITKISSEFKNKTIAFDKDLKNYAQHLIGGAEAYEAAEKIINENAEAFH